ncbi:hypothetical protein HHI36_016075 [Cryptolaemus montrouzieri]|uniref:Peptidase M14 domain-containing protein n=1 Tax=Cryptolaemus montrouzieri TaxID=559131 RepID=A0ABD2N7S9_9CUCU
MSSTSCYDDSPTELSEAGSINQQMEDDEDDDNTIVITQTKIVARRYEIWHEKFLCYKEILDYLMKMGQMYKHKMSIERLGYSKEEKPICLVKIHSEKSRRYSMSVMIEAGSNGKEKMTVSSALYLVEYLVKNNNKLLVEYLIIPCLNPDGYDKCMNSKKITKKEEDEIDLSRSFPKCKNTEYMNISELLAAPPETSQNCLILMKVIEKYKTSVKLFISLQASESSITYPLDFYFKDVFDFAVACKKAMGWNTLDLKPIVPIPPEKNGTAVEHVIKNYHDNIKFAYILNVHNKCFVPEEKFIMAKGEQTSSGILTLSKRVYRYYFRQRTRYNVKTVVKLLDTTE